MQESEGCRTNSFVLFTVLSDMSETVLIMEYVPRKYLLDQLMLVSKKNYFINRLFVCMYVCCFYLSHLCVRIYYVCMFQ
jgi:hypothetical protein